MTEKTNRPPVRELTTPLLIRKEQHGKLVATLPKNTVVVPMQLKDGDIIEATLRKKQNGA